MKQLRRVGLSILILLALFAAGYFGYWALRAESYADALAHRGADAPTQIVAGDVSAELNARLSTLLLGTREQGGLPSLSVAVYREGTPLWQGVTGFENLESSTPADLDTRYVIGSVSKAVSAVIAAALVDEGSVAVDRPITDYATALPEDYARITLRHLLSHQSGIRHYGFAFNALFSETADATDCESVEDALPVFVNDPRAFDAGGGFSYSTFGFTLASYVLEQASGESYPALLERHVLGPLGLDAPFAVRRGDSDRLAGPYIVLYEDAEGVAFRAPAASVSCKWAGGGLAASPSEIAELAGRLSAGEVVSPEGLAMLWTETPLSDGTANPQGYGIGWRIQRASLPDRDDVTVTIVHHGGVSAGYMAALIVLPQWHLAVAASTNAMLVDGVNPAMEAARQIARWLMEERSAELASPSAERTGS